MLSITAASSKSGVLVGAPGEEESIEPYSSRIPTGWSRLNAESSREHSAPESENGGGAPSVSSGRKSTRESPQESLRSQERKLPWHGGAKISPRSGGVGGPWGGIGGGTPGLGGLKSQDSLNFMGVGVTEVEPKMDSQYDSS